MDIHLGMILDPMDVVSSDEPEYWWTFGRPPRMGSGVTLHHSAMPGAYLGHKIIREHCGQRLLMECVDVQERAIEYRQVF